MKTTKFFMAALVLAAVVVGCKPTNDPKPWEKPDSSDTTVVTPLDPPADERGTEANPYKVADLCAMKTDGTLPAKDGGTAAYWVEGYIIGSYNFNASPQWIIGTENVDENNVLLADDAASTDTYNVAAVKLGDYKSVLNLKANPANLGKKLKIHGIVEKYCGVGGVVKIDKVLLDGQEVQLPGVADVEIDPAKEYTPSEIAALAAQLQAGKTSSVEATIVGYVSEITEPYGEEYKNITFHMSDTKGGENQFYIYRAKGGDVASVAVGSKVKVVAKIQNFRGNTPETSGTVTVTILE